MPEGEVPEGWWRVDLHTHTWFSPDSQTDPAALVSRALELGLSRIAVSDHNTIRGALDARKLAPECVIVGEEIRTATGGELLAYYVREEIPAGLSLSETIGRLRDQDAVISVSHPLDRLRRGSALGMDLTLSIIEVLDALEVFNARCLLSADNTRAFTLAERYGKAMTAGSDGHTLGEIGAGYMWVPPFRDSPDAFRLSLAQGRPAGCLSGVWPHFASTWAKWASGRQRSNMLSL